VSFRCQLFRPGESLDRVMPATPAHFKLDGICAASAPRRHVVFVRDGQHPVGSDLLMASTVRANVEWEVCIRKKVSP